METFTQLMEKHGLAGVVIFALGVVIWKYMLPQFQRIADTNDKQAESLVKVTENLAMLNRDLPKHIDEAKEEIIKTIKASKE